MRRRTGSAGHLRRPLARPAPAPTWRIDPGPWSRHHHDITSISSSPLRVYLAICTDQPRRTGGRRLEPGALKKALAQGPAGIDGAQQARSGRRHGGDSPPAQQQQHQGNQIHSARACILALLPRFALSSPGRILARLLPAAAATRRPLPSGLRRTRSSTPPKVRMHGPLSVHDASRSWRRLTLATPSVSACARRRARRLRRRLRRAVRRALAQEPVHPGVPHVLPHLPLRAGGHGRQPGDLRQVLHGLDHARQQDQMPVRGGARPAAGGVAGGGTVFGVPRPRAARERGGRTTGPSCTVIHRL